MTNEQRIKKALMKIENFEKTHLVFAGNVADILEGEMNKGLTLKEADKVISYYHMGGANFGRGSVKFLKEQLRLRRKK